MPLLTDPQRLLLERLAQEGKPTPLVDAEVKPATHLAEVGLVFLIGKSEPLAAVIMPKGRNVLAELGYPGPKVPKPPARLTD